MLAAEPTKVHGGYMILNDRRDRDRDGPKMVLELPIPFMYAMFHLFTYHTWQVCTTKHPAAEPVPRLFQPPYLP